MSEVTQSELDEITAFLDFRETMKGVSPDEIIGVQTYNGQKVIRPDVLRRLVALASNGLGGEV